jgi:hypothetical protein
VDREIANSPSPDPQPNSVRPAPRSFRRPCRGGGRRGGW